MSTMQDYVYVMIGGAIGSAARMALSDFAAIRFGDRFPVGTFLANFLGCFAIGFVLGVLSPGGPLVASDAIRKLIVVGILGGFTTFSSFSYQTIQLFQSGQVHYAFANMGLSLVVCLLSTWWGLALGQMVLR
ncbi:MAG: fluoride efflux transporter CrcB [Chthoniobacterales bacterium]|nr:fluoride efflux transporter CrcB [Chthoniobacterales bacterium]